MQRLISFFIVTGAVLAGVLGGGAGAASAGATIDLIWADTGTNELSDVELSSAVTLQVILTTGPNGSRGAGVSVDSNAEPAIGTGNKFHDPILLAIRENNDVSPR